MKKNGNFIGCRFLVSYFRGSITHGSQELIIISGAFHAVLDEFHRLDTVTVRQEAAKNPHAVKGFGSEQQIIAPC